MKKISLFNGNGHRYKIDMPTLFILSEHINDVALDHIRKNTGIDFKFTGWGYTAIPKSHYQMTKLFLTYNFKTQYHNNASTKNIIYLKFCTDKAFQIKDICYNCCRENQINVNGLSQGDRLLV